MLLGVAISLAALFAFQLGLDSNATWGPSRYLLLIVGATLTLLPFGRSLASTVQSGVDRLWRWVRSHRLILRAAQLVRDGANAVRPVFKNPAVERVGDGIGSAYAAVHRRSLSLPLLGTLLRSPRTKVHLSGAVILGLATFFQAWIGSVGFLDPWPRTTDYYDLLAAGLANGRLDLGVDPPPEFAALDDPYSLEARAKMPPLWDTSYYEGKFYLYWGPAPTLPLALAKLVGGIRLGDNLLALGYLVGLAFLLQSLIKMIWRRWFSHLAWWTTIPPMAAAAFANPLPWVMGRPAIYEASIVAGQFFLLAGFVSAFSALLVRRRSALLTLFTGMSWALAVGSRVTLAPAVIVLSGFVLFVLWKQRAVSTPEGWRRLVTLIAPLALGAFLLVGYNMARFGDPFEFGHRYQLGRVDFFHDYEGVVTTDYVIPNLYNYLLNSPAFLKVFPFLKPRWGQYYIWPAHYYAPEGYHTEQVTGLLLSVPFLWLSLPLIAYVRSLIGSSEGRPKRDGKSSEVFVAGVVFLGAGLLALAPLLTFLANSMRHLVDVVPMGICLASLGYFSWIQRAPGEAGIRRGRFWLAAVLALITIATGALLSVTGYNARFEKLNPALFEWLTRALAF